MIKASKSQFRWKLSLEGNITVIEVFNSKLSGKRRVYRDGILICDKQLLEGSFSYTFNVQDHTFVVMQHGEHYELKIDNISYSHLHA